MADEVVSFGDGRIIGRHENAIRKAPLELKW
jgi:hypothetical protein